MLEWGAKTLVVVSSAVAMLLIWKSVIVDKNNDGSNIIGLLKLFTEIKNKRFVPYQTKISQKDV